MTSRVTESTKHPHPPGHESDRPPSPPDPVLSIPAHILIVDDDPIVLMAMETLLDGPNRIIVKAETGQDALRHLLRHDFAVVLLDVRMPRLDGYETAALVRQRERSRFTPIIFLSGVDTLDADVVRGLTSGAVDYLVKPVVPEILKNKVSVFVDLYRLREQVKQQAVRQSEERFRLLVEGVQDYAIFLLDRAGLVTTWNIGAERLTGHRSTDILGRHYECFYPNEEVASGQPAGDLQMAAAEGSRAEQDRWMVRKDSTRFIANVVVTGLRNEPGNLQGYAVVIRDVTERREAEAATARLAAIVESSDDAIVSLKLDGIVTSWNRGAEKLFGYSTDEMLGQPIQRLIPSGRVEEEEEILSRMRRGDRIEHYETVRKHKSGRLIDVSLTASPMTDSGGTVIGASKISRDITERKQAEKAMIESEERTAADLRAITQLYEVGNFCGQAENGFEQCLGKILDTAISITGATKGNIQLSGREPGSLTISAHRGFEAAFLEFFSHVSNHTASACGAAMLSADRVVIEDVTQSDIFAGQPALGVLLDAGVRAVQSTPLVSSAGHLLGMISTHFAQPYHPSKRELRLMDLLARQAADYLERRCSEESLRVQNQTLRQQAQTLDLANLIVRDLDSHIIQWNVGAQRLYGFESQEALGWNSHDRLQTTFPLPLSEIETILMREGNWHGEMRHRAKDGRTIVVSSHWILHRNESGEPVAILEVNSDITERKRAEEQLWKLATELEQRVEERTSELVHMRDRLRAFAMQLNLTEQRERRRLANDLHDYLAQLLVVVRIKLMQAAPLIPDGRAARLLKEADQAITQSLDYTRSLVSELAPPTLHDFGLLPGLEWLASQMQQHGLAIVVKRNIDTLPLPEDQAVLIYQAVRELLFNVLKHAAANQATISVTVTPQDTLEVTVVDDGNGFDLAVITTPTIGSKCFGLFSIRERMQVLGGRLELDSAVGQGTRATLVIPYRPMNEPAESPGTPQPVSTQHSEPNTENKLPHSAPAPLRVLLVDDHAMVRQGLRSLLEGHDDVQVVGEAGDGALGIELVGSLTPDVVVMDVTMPRIDGIEATRRIRQNHPSIAVVGLSVHGTSQVEAAMKAAGAALFVSKDAAGDELYEAIMAAGAVRSQG